MFDHWIHEVVNYIHHNPGMGELFAFVVAFIESLPIFGTIIPGSITMTAVGTMIGAGLIPGYWTLLLASLGAFAGDTIGFASGLILKDRIRHIWPFSRWPKLLSASETFFKKHGGKSILIGRFVGAARSAVPLIAGVFRLSWTRFVIAAVPSAIIWAVVYSIPGMVLGAFSTDIPPALLSEYIAIGVGIIFLLWVIFWLIQRFFSNIVQWFGGRINTLWSQLKRQHSTHWFIDYLTDRQHPYDHHQLTRFLMAVLCLACFIVILVSVLIKGSIYGVNEPMFHFAQSFRAYHFNAFFVTITLMAKPIIVFVMGIGIALVLGLLKQWRSAVHLAGLMVVTMFLVWLIKTVHYNARPEGFMIVANSSSFPSGHTAMATSLFAFIAILTADLLKKSNRWIAHLTALIFILLVGASRLFLGAHWFLDVLGSIFMSMSLVLLTSMNYHRAPKPNSIMSMGRYRWLTISLGIIIVCWAGYAAAMYNKARYRYTPFVNRISISATEWHTDPLEFAPAFRTTRFGNPAEPLNVQWVGPIVAVKKTLMLNHWKVITRSNYLEDTIKRLATKKPEYHLSFLKLLYHNERPVLILYKPVKGDKSVYMLHLWDSHITVGKEHMWIGMLNKLIPPHAIITFNHETLMSFNIHGIQSILLGQGQRWDLDLYPTSNHTLPNRPPWYHWDGRIALISPE